MEHERTDRRPAAFGRKVQWLLVNRAGVARNVASLARAIARARKLPEGDEKRIARKIHAAIAQDTGKTNSYDAIKAEFSSDTLETVAGLYAFEHALWKLPFAQFVESLSRREQPLPTDDLCIAVTGSREVDSARATQQVAILLQPYLGRRIVWYCGASGMVDEIAAHFLVAAGEKVNLVGNRKWDVSSSMKALIDGRKATHIDESVETFHRTLLGSPRAKYFVSRTRLAIIFWNGKSKGSQRLLESFRENGINHLTAFV